MPTIYRTMKRAADGLPVVGSNSKELGVRVPPNANTDVNLDSDGNVILDRSGMSVAENWTDLPGHLIPKRLKAFFEGATGSNALSCYKLGTGPFSPGPLNEQS
jgi:hypothetical protein